ncbi:hypothetical protein DPMN_084093, partial [Dreissena polymorpha]
SQGEQRPHGKRALPPIPGESSLRFDTDEYHRICDKYIDINNNSPSVSDQEGTATESVQIEDSNSRTFATFSSSIKLADIHRQIRLKNGVEPGRHSHGECADRRCKFQDLRNFQQ